MSGRLFWPIICVNERKLGSFSFPSFSREGVRPRGFYREAPLFIWWRQAARQRPFCAVSILRTINKEALHNIALISLSRFGLQLHSRQDKHHVYLLSREPWFSHVSHKPDLLSRLGVATTSFANNADHLQLPLDGLFIALRCHIITTNYCTPFNFKVKIGSTAAKRPCKQYTGPACRCSI